MIFTVAIDGPAAAGKGTISRAVASAFGFAHLDTGLLYRAVGALGGDPVDFQRRFARREGGAVLDGRDIGTVICPEAEVKLYVTASAESRAQRRWLEVGGDAAQVLAEVIERDARDMSRAEAPLRPAADAITLDTTSLSADEAIARALAQVRAKL
jgi:CMP/dCMP kinase